MKIVIEDLHVVLRSADIASEGGHSKPRLDLVCPYDDSFENNQGPNESRVELPNRADNAWLQGSIDDDNVELAMHSTRNHLILSKVALIKTHHVLLPLLFQRIFKLIP